MPVFKTIMVNNMTPKQKANQARFKKVMAEAKKLRSKNKTLTQAQAVKQAWAIMYSKGGKVGYKSDRTNILKTSTVYMKKYRKKGLNRKEAIKQANMDAVFVGASFNKQQKTFEKQKKVNDAINKKFANWQYPVPPVYTGNWTIKTWTDYITKNGYKIGATKVNKNKYLNPIFNPYQPDIDYSAKIKKAAKKSKQKKSAVKVKRTSEMHTDTKSHNVNIRVVSGVVNIMDLKRDLDKTILLLESAKMASIDKNNTNYLINKPLVFKNITEKKWFIKHYNKQVKILKNLYKNTIKEKTLKSS